MGKHIRRSLLGVAIALLAWSFWRDAGWLQLCAGLAMFLFGMQCLEEGLRQLAGGRLEQLLARSTGTAGRGLLFGIGGTVVLQSSTLVSLLTIAFISSGLVQLAGGLAIIFGANLGATSGIWLLALAGHDLSLSPLALPLLVFGVLAGFTGARGRAAGRVVLGVAFVFLGIDQVKSGFAAFGGNLDLAALPAGGAGGVLLFVLAGAAATVVLQSSHATLMLILAALAAGQLELGQALALAIGSNVGSSVSTAVVGALGGNRSGQRLALAHVLFNVSTATLALLLLPLLAWMVGAIARFAGFGGNPLLQLALFHTLFNATGVVLFWPWQGRLAHWLQRWLPDRAPPPPAASASEVTPERARHLSGQALDSADAAAAAVALELRHLGALSREAICRALGLPPAAADAPSPDDPLLDTAPADCPDADVLYRQRVKGVYADLLAFMGRIAVPLDEEHQRFWTQAQMAAARMVEAVRDARTLQRNLLPRLREADSPRRAAYLDLRRHLYAQMRELHALHAGQAAPEARTARLQVLAMQGEGFVSAFRRRVLVLVGQGALDGLQAASLLNDLGHVEAIDRNLRALAAAEEPRSLRALRRLAGSSAQPGPLSAPAATVENAN